MSNITKTVITKHKNYLKIKFENKQHRLPTILFELLEVLGTKDFYRVVIQI